MLTSHEILDGMSLQKILERLIEVYGFDGLNLRLKMNCFAHNPSIKSSLVFLRKTPWAREKVENLYIQYMQNKK